MNVDNAAQRRMLTVMVKAEVFIRYSQIYNSTWLKNILTIF